MVVSLQDSVRIYLPNCGLPDVFTMQQRGLVQKFEPLSVVLIEENHVNPSKCAPMYLASIIANMRRFLDKAFGREAKVDQADAGYFTVWPAIVFSDFSPNGSLHCILRSVFSFMDQFKLESIDFDVEANFDLNLKLVQNITKSLELERHLPKYHAYFAPTINEKELERLQLLAQRHGINIVSNPNFATHVLYPDPPHLRENQTDHQVLVRVIDSTHFHNQLHYLVHWFYHPDSYNEWLPQKDVLGHIYHPKPPQPYRSWHLQTRWLRDLDLHNEWMNELDYEMPSTFGDFVGIPPPVNITSFRPCLVRIHLHQNTHASYSQISDPAHLNPIQNDHIPSLSKSFTQLADRTSGGTKPNILQNGVPLSSSALSFDNQTERHIFPNDKNLHNNMELTLSTSRPGACDDAEADDDEPLIRRIVGFNDKNIQRLVDNINIGEGVFLPKFSSWFNLNEIHDIEKRSLPEFFSRSCPSKTPTTYKEIRNFIVMKWRASPKHHLSSSCVRRCIAGDACSIFRLHAFLNHWRLINYMSQTDAHPSQYCIRPPPVLPAMMDYPSILNNETKIPACFVLDDGSIAKIQNHKIINTSTEIVSVPGSRLNLTAGTKFRTVDSRNSAGPRSQRKPVEYHCDSCGTDCSDLRFHCTTKADMDLCATCYQNGRYATDLEHSDFIEMVSVTTSGPNDEENGNIWTENESMLLLDALEMYGDDWHLVADHVGSKSMTQCVMHFLQLPVEDSFLNTSRAAWWPRHPKQDPKIPSPIEVLRQTGVNEESLIAVATKTGFPKVHSGEPPVSAGGDGMVIPFVTTLASSCSNDVTVQIVNDLGIDAVKMEESYERVLASLDDGRKNDLMPDKPEEVCNGRLYDELSSRILHPASVVSTEFGDSIINAVSTFSKKSPGSPTEPQYSTCLENSDCDVLKEFRDQMDENEGSDFGTDLNEKPDAMTADHDHGEKRLATVSDVALLCASVVAAQHAMVEDVEIERLTKLSVEFKLERVKRKLKHLADTVDLYSKTERVLKRRREQNLWGQAWKKHAQHSSAHIVTVEKALNAIDDAACTVRPCDATTDASLTSQDCNSGGSFSTRTATTPMADAMRGPKLPASTLSKLKLREVKSKSGSVGQAHDRVDPGNSGNFVSPEVQKEFAVSS